MPRFTLPEPNWRWALFTLAALWCAIVWVQYDTAAQLVGLWMRSETYAHAWVVPPIALWIAWRKRHQVQALNPTPCAWVLLPMAAMGCLWLAGELVGVNIATQFALMALLVMAVPLVLGLAVARVLMFPLLFLFFAVPAGDSLTPQLMQWTADFTITAVRLSGVPVYREGLQFVIPTGSWSVVEACSGIRYLMASLMVGTLFAYLNYQSLQKRLVFVGVSIVVPVVANWLRAYMIVMLGHLSGNRLAVGADHLLYGWVFFGIVIMSLYWIGVRWAEAAPDLPVLPPARGHWPVAQGGAVVALATALVVGPYWAAHRLDANGPDVPVALVLPADLPGGWHAGAALAPAWQPFFAETSALARTDYQSADGAAVGVLMGYYRHQNEARKLISSRNRLVKHDDHGWNLLGTSARGVALEAGALEVMDNQLLQTDAAGAYTRQHLRVWQFYWVDGRWVASDAMGKLHGIWGRLAGRGDDSAVVLLYADDSNSALAAAVLTRFLNTGLPALRAQLEATRQKALAGSQP